MLIEMKCPPFDPQSAISNQHSEFSNQHLQISLVASGCDPQSTFNNQHSLVASGFSRKETSMRHKRAVIAILTTVAAGSVAFTQPGRGGSQWLTAFADAQRTSWVRADDKVSVASMSKPGFELQWKVKLDNQPRGLYGLGQGVSASGVTLFVPMSLVTGSSNNLYAIDNDTGYVVWQRHFDAAMPEPTPQCPGGITSAATRIVRLDATATAAAAGLSFGRGAAGYRSLLGEPGEGVPLEGRVAGPGRATGDAGGGARAVGAAPGAARGAATPGQTVGRGAPQVEKIPGAPPIEQGGPFGMLFRPSGVAYV